MNESCTVGKSKKTWLDGVNQALKMNDIRNIRKTV